VNPDRAASILITRINLSRPDPDWFSPRLEYFRRFCIPSVQAQRHQPTRWLLLFDKQTPVDFCKEVMRGVNGVRLFTKTPIAVKSIKAWIKKNISTDWVITTRFDSDDALHPLYLQDVQRASRPKKELLSLPDGWATHAGRVFKWRWHSAFVSLVERNNDAMNTVNKGAHDRLAARYPYRVLHNKRRWLYVLHDRNLSGDKKIQEITKQAVEVPKEIINTEFEWITL